ncbi:zinc finger, CCHC-type containing protein [Tanacetum coccineum]
MTTVRTLMSKMLFLNGDLNEEVFMTPRVSHKPVEVCKLRKVVYGLKQALRAWSTTGFCIFLGWFNRCGEVEEVIAKLLYSSKEVLRSVVADFWCAILLLKTEVSNNDAAVAQRRLEDKQLKEKTNTDCLIKEQEKVHLGIKVGANIMITGVPGQEGAEGNIAEKKKVKESMKVNLGKLLKYNA